MKNCLVFRNIINFYGTSAPCQKHKRTTFRRINLKLKEKKNIRFFDLTRFACDLLTADTHNVHTRTLRSSLL